MPTRYNRALCWIRRDLRLSDHTALAEACAAARRVAVVFVFDTSILSRLEDRDDRRVTFIHRSLRELDERLRELGSALIVRHGDPRREIPALAEMLHADAVYTNRDHEPSALERDAAVGAALAGAGRAFGTFKDQVVFEGAEVATGAGTPFRVFTPYKRAWLALLESRGERDLAERSADLARLLPHEDIEPSLHAWDMTSIGFTESALWLEAGERAAAERLAGFMERIGEYGRLRDVPSADGTSGLSVHLRFGTISVRALLRAALAAERSAPPLSGDDDGAGGGADKWISELIWREFYQMILACFPHVVGGAFKREFDAIAWPGTEENFAAWCEGRTGYPIVDAAMRCLNATGWMHNRLRMIVASFLVKDLLVDWRWGEAYFARHLLDFDLASNNGGWQWCASTGCDAQPWFRIFNPTLQSEKFDPEGSFIREWCPEPAGFSNKRIHFPAAADMFEQNAARCIIGQDYPPPIVEHAAQRERALKLYKAVGGER